jgi:8-oxo-dGTP pyrophosphatase MutT (NUDIX family)
MSKKSWKTLTNITVYDNPWLEVQHHEVINPNGGDGIYGVVHFKNYAIGIIALDENGNTWIVGQHRYPLETYSWELPEGGGPFEDTPLKSAKRELKEEVGISANKWVKLLEIHTSNSVTDEFGIVFIAQDLKFGETEHEDTEDITIRKLHFSELVEMIMKGEITDSITISAVLKLQLMIERGEFEI